MSGDHLVWVIPAVGRFAQQQRDLRVLRYLTAPEIARELSVSPNTVRTHVKNLYAKLGTNRRAGRSSAAASWDCSRPGCAVHSDQARSAVRRGGVRRPGGVPLVALLRG
jgi:hypothetical protein